MFTTILIQPIFNLLAVIYTLVHDFGLAIMILTIMIRLLLWPLVTRQLHSQRALQDLQPEIQKIKEKAGGDRQLEGQLTMELYKEREINPFASFLPLLIQLPIFIALYWALRDTVKASEIAKLAYEPVKNLAPIAAIIHGHGDFHPVFLGFIGLTTPSPIMAVLAGAAQFIQTKQITPKQQAGDSQAQMMAGMTYVFPLLTFFIGLSLPAALSLYWTTSSAMAILQQTIVLHRDVVELEEGTPPAPERKSKSVAQSKAKSKARKGRA